MKRSARQRHLLVLVSALALIAAACSVTGTRDRVAIPPVGTVQWQDCGDLQCGRIRVPLDYDDPGGEKIELTAWLNPADEPAEKVGTLFVNPGGPGGTGESIIESSDYFLWSNEIHERFDIVGFDPRGTGESATLRCGDDRYLQEMYDADPSIEDEADRDELLDVSEAYVDQCEQANGESLAHMGTLDVARDLDEWRKAVGDEKLTYLGYSYGTSIGQMYAHLYPTRIRAMVLDGVVDTEQTGLSAADIQAKGFEQTLHAFFDDCEQDPDCPIRSDPEGITERVIAQAEREPIPAADADRPATPGLVQLGMGQAMYTNIYWPTLADAIAEADDGDGTSIVDLADDYLQRESDGQYPDSSSLYFAVSCLDSEWPDDPDGVLDAAEATGEKYPYFGEGLVNDYVRCPLWPVDPQPLPIVEAEGSPPILVVSTTGDAATPYENGVTVAERLPQGVLLTYEGDTHGIVGQGEPCVDNAFDRYILELEPPADGTRCE